MISLRQVCTALDKRSENIIVVYPVPEAGFTELQALASDVLAEARGSGCREYVAAVARAIRTGKGSFIDHSGEWEYRVGDQWL